MTVAELIAKLSEVEDLNMPVLLGGDGSKCLGIEDNTEDDEKAVFVYFANA